VKLLLDANIVIWMLETPERLNASVRDAIVDPSNQLYVSAATLLEITAKAATGRLTFDAESLQRVSSQCRWLPVEAAHAWRVRSLPPIHKDPFDRIIVAQAMLEDMTLVTSDKLLLDYSVAIILT
jgi:PIN domain nuclease of toxin-antitoxin system